MVIQHELDRKQRFRDGHQFAVSELAAAIDIGLYGFAVSADVFTGLFGVDQSKRVFDACEHADQLGHIRRIGVVLTDAQIERVLDAQNVLFDDRGDAFQQGIVPAEQTAFRMRDFLFIRHDPGQFENLINLFQCRRCAGITRNEVEQFLRQANGRKMADLTDAPMIEEIDFLVDFHQALFEGIITFNAAVRKRGKQSRSNPEQFTAGFFTALRADPAADRGQFSGGIGIGGIVKPALQMRLELQREGREVGIIALAADLRNHIFRKRLLGRRGVNGLFTENALAADRTKFVDQRQQHHRHIAVAVLQTLQVIRELHDALHQQ